MTTLTDPDVHAITVFAARNIITMNPSCPTATHVAVRHGRILGVGSLADVAAWGPYQLDDSFADMTLMPGLIEGHSHLMTGSLWRYTYCGYFDLRDHEGTLWPGSSSLAEVVTSLARVARNADVTSINGWGFDPIYFGSERCSRFDLDQVSDTLPVGVLHASGHILNVNTVALQRAGLLRKDVDHPGIPLGDDGMPTGELKGPEAMMMGIKVVGLNRNVLSGDAFGIEAFGRLAVAAGVTTATDLAAALSDEEVEELRSITSDPAYPLRLVSLLRFTGATPSKTIERAVELAQRSTEMLRLGRVKVVVDGSIQGYSARMRWPGYINGAPNGLWYVAPEAVLELFAGALQHGVQVHAHTNGDEATDMVLDSMQTSLRQHPSPDHRFILQHCQLADAAQFRRMKALGMGVNLFANHHFYWGDQHRSVTVGPERAERMNACRTAEATGVPFAIHSDAPITPLGPLFTAWCAVNRLTASGRVLGANERISVDSALHAITLGAAWTLGLDGEVGSIECGKRADFCVLLDDPTAADPAKLKDVRIWGTVQGGRVFSAR